MSQQQDNAPSGSKRLVFGLLGLGFSLLLFEVLASVVLLHVYRGEADAAAPFDAEPTPFASINLPAWVLRGLRDPAPAADATAPEFRAEIEPDPMVVEHPVLGWAPQPGRYTHTFFRREDPAAPWEHLVTEVTIGPDGARSFGPHDDSAPRIYVFGDSFVFGTGVHDDQTFAYRLQQAFPDHVVKLFAFGGYGMGHAWLRFGMLEADLRPEDRIVLGYADYYDARNVADPARLRSAARFRATRNPETQDIRRTTPRIILENGALSVDYLEFNCRFNAEYCESRSPSRRYKRAVSAALMNDVAARSPGPVWVVHFQGDTSNPVLGMLDDDITVVSALDGDFDGFVRDDIEGFDAHPGPYWHHAMGRRIAGALRTAAPVPRTEP
ncbi:MAG: hypothetical protein AAGE01_00150 [Pseudomonadota bacterium]